MRLGGDAGAAGIFRAPASCQACSYAGMVRFVIARTARRADAAGTLDIGGTECRPEALFTFP